MADDKDPGAKLTRAPELAAVFELYRQHLPEEAQVLANLAERLFAGAEKSRDELRRFLHRVAGTAGTYEHFDIANAALDLKRRVDAGASPEDLRPGLLTLVHLFKKNGGLP